MRACPEAANHIVLMFIDYDVHLHIFVFISFMIIFFNREEEFNMRACPEAANHSRYLAWDMQVLEEEQAFHGSVTFAFVEEDEYEE